MKKILFICLGNICRSPMAEYIFRNHAQQHGLAVQVASAGTSGWHNGEGMHCGTAEILDNLNINSNDFVSNGLKDSDFYDYDYLIVMDDNNLHAVEQRFGHHPDKIFKITDLFISEYDHVPDPWYTGNFNETCEILTKASHALVQKIKNNQL